MQFTRFAAVAAIGLTALPAEAGEEPNFMLDTAGQLARLCETAPSHPNFAAAIHMCHGYILGVHHMHQAMAGAIESPFYCVPASPPSRDRIAADFASFVLADPETAGLEALDALMLFAIDRFPCP
ncbi:MAG: Rap1a/Tai family immunity protein [Paracoccaceae bacterium]